MPQSNVQIAQSDDTSRKVGMIRLLAAGEFQLDLDALIQALAGAVDRVQVATLPEVAGLASQAEVVLVEARTRPEEALRALRALRSQPETASIPVLVLTDLAGAIEALGAGATAISRAPSDPATVAEEVRHLVGRPAGGGTTLRFRPDLITIDIPDPDEAGRMARLIAGTARLVLQVSPYGVRFLALGEEPVVLDIPMCWEALELVTGARLAVACGGRILTTRSIDRLELFAGMLPPLDEEGGNV